MNNLYKKLNKELEHVKLSAAERGAMRARIFDLPDKGLSASPVQVTQSPYLFLSQKWMVAFASFVLVVFAGGSTAFAAQGALPGDPLYAIKTNVIEPVRVALAPSAAERAAVHVAIAQTRVEEAEVLTQKGALTESVSLALAENFETNAAEADLIASTLSEATPAVAAEIQTKLEASAAAGGAVLAVLAERGHDEQKNPARNLAARILARANISNSRTAAFAPSDAAGSSAISLAIAPTTATATAEPAQSDSLVRTFSATTATGTESTTDSGTGSGASAELRVETVSLSAKEVTAANQLKIKAQEALELARAQLLAASSTLDASTTIAIESSLAGIDLLIYDGTQATDDAFFDTAVRDFTEALSQSLKLRALLKAEQSYDLRTIVPWLKLQNESGN